MDVVSPARQYLAGFTKSFQIFGALINRKAVFLDSYDWMTIPWNTPKSINDKAVDICAQIPRILELLDQMQITGTQTTDNLEFLLDICWRLDNELQVWSREFVSTCNNVHHTGATHSATQAPDPNAPLTAETNIIYEHSRALSIYWIACIFVYTVLRLLWQQCDNALYLLPHRIDPLRYASLISRSMPYFSAPNSGECSLLFYSMSMGTALHCFSVSSQLDSPDAYRILNVFQGLQDETGIGIRVGLFLKTLAAASVTPRGNLDRATHEEMENFGKRWWGGGKKALTLRPRTPPPKADAM